MKPTREQRHERECYDWLKASFIATSGYGHAPDVADYNALPPEARSVARAIVKRTLETFDEGHQGVAREAAARDFATLAETLPWNWAPPANEDNPRDLAAQVGRGF